MSGVAGQVVTQPGRIPRGLTAALVLVLVGCGGDNPVDPGPQNRAPIARVEVSPPEVPEGDDHQTVVTLNGTGSSDADGDPLTHQWSVPGAVFTAGTSASSPVAQVTVPGTAAVGVTLTVTDGRGGSAQAQATIGLGPPLNRPPTASMTVTPDEIPQGDAHQTVVTLNGAASSDPDADPLTFEWTIPGASFVNGTDSASATAQITLAGTAETVVTLRVEDGRGGVGTAQDTITLSSSSNRAPVAAITPSGTSIPTNDRNRSVLVLDGSASTDPDGDSLLFAWSAPGATFENGSGPEDRTVDLSFDGTQGAVVRLTVRDGQGGVDSAQVSLTLGPIITRDDPSFALDVQEIFNRRGCTSSGCHGAARSAGLDLRAGSSYANLVGVTATSESIVRVIAGNANGSYLVIKLEGRQSVGLQMPRGGSPLNAVDLANIKNWINRGASNN